MGNKRRRTLTQASGTMREKSRRSTGLAGQSRDNAYRGGAGMGALALIILLYGYIDNILGIIQWQYPMHLFKKILHTQATRTIITCKYTFNRHCAIRLFMNEASALGMPTLPLNPYSPRLTWISDASAMHWPSEKHSILRELPSGCISASPP